jgi:hypothetical protein
MLAITCPPVAGGEPSRVDLRLHGYGHAITANAISQ